MKLRILVIAILAAGLVRLASGPEAASRRLLPAARPGAGEFGADVFVHRTPPLVFTENRGQWPDSILFRAEARGTVIWLTPTGVLFQFAWLVNPDHEKSYEHPLKHTASPRDDEGNRVAESRTQMVKLSFSGAGARASMVPGGKRKGSSHFFLGNDPERWRTHVASYERITYRGLQPGVDLICVGEDGLLKLELSATRTEAKTSMRVSLSDTTSVFVNGDGVLQLRSPDGAPLLDLADGVHFTPLESAAFAMSVSDDRVNRKSGATAFLEYRTYLGGSMYDLAQSIAVDDSGYAYVAGRTDAADFPTVGPYQTDQPNTDAFLTKMTREGDGVVYSTYVGGSNIDLGIEVVVDDSGHAYLAGTTYSPDFPTPNGWATHNAGSDAFVIKFAPEGDSVVYGSCLGGSGTETFGGLAVDDRGRAYLVGTTQSANFPVSDPFQATLSGTGDAFVARFDEVAGGLSYSTFLGGSNFDQAHAVAVDTAYRAYVGGQTLSADFPLVNPYMTYQGSEDAFVVRLSADGTVMHYGTILAGSGSASDFVEAIEVDPAENIFVTGSTNASDFPVVNAYQPHQGGFDVFVSKIQTGSAGLVFSTYLGGSAGDQPKDLAIDSLGRVCVVGLTLSTNFPTFRAHQADLPGEDAFVTVWGTTGVDVVRSTYLGGSGNEWAHSVALDPLGHIYVVGFTNSIDFPIFHEYQTYQGNTDAYVVKLCGDQDFDCIPDSADNCPIAYNPDQEDVDFNGVGDSCDVGDPLVFSVYSPIDLVITDPAGDSIGIDSISRVIFNTILLGSSYDTLTDLNSADLTGPDGEPDDIVTIPNPLLGVYRMRIVREPGASDSAHFTAAMRINGNQQLIPEAYHDALVASLGSPEVPYVATYTTTMTLPGDTNADGLTTSADIIFMVNFVFKGGVPPVVPGHGDVNCDGFNTTADIIRLVNYVFKGGLAPCTQSGG